MELPKAARRLVDDETITIEGGLALVQLVDHPDVLDTVVAEVRTGYANVECQVSHALRQMESDAKVAEGRAKTEAKGLVVVDHEGYRPTHYVELGTFRVHRPDGPASYRKVGVNKSPDRASTCADRGADTVRGAVPQGITGEAS